MMKQVSELDILARMNESLEDDAATSTINCPQCGTNVDTAVLGAARLCPECGTGLTTPEQFAAEDAAYDPEVDIDGLTDVAESYAGLVAEGRMHESMQLLRANKCEAVHTADGIMLEKYVVKVAADGSKKKVKVKTKKVRLTAKQKSALAKARKKSHTASASKHRAKAMKVRRRLGL